MLSLADLADEELIDRLQYAAFGWLLKAANPLNGLVSDNSDKGAPASIAVVGFALSCWPVGVARGWINRERAVALTLATLRFFAEADQNSDGAEIGHKGFFYHFLDMKE